MATSHDFESRRRERRRRERLRKKRIRAAVILIALIGIITILCVAISTCKKNNEPSQQSGTAQTETTMLPQENATAMPTPGYSFPSASEQNNLMQIISDSGQEKRCYLTFDDGPTENITPQILDVLRRYNIKATFFEVGSLIKANPDMARRVYEEGHLIANHSNGHHYEKLYATKDAFINEINECYEAIKSVTGEAEPFKLVRFPGGSYDSSSDSYSPVKQECKKLLQENGYYYCDWNSLTGDAEGKKKDTAGLLSYLKSNLNTSRNAIVLMHDAAAKQATADALPSVIEYLMSEGYTFHRLDEIDYKKSSTSTNGESTSSASSTSSPSPTSSASSSPSPTSSASTSPSPTSSASASPSPTGSASPTSAPTARPTKAPATQSGPIIIN